MYKPQDEEEPAAEEEEAEEEEEEKDDEDRPLGTTVVLRDLSTGKDLEIPHVTAYTFDEPCRFLAYAVAGPWGELNGLYVRSLDSDSEPAELHSQKAGRYNRSDLGRGVEPFGIRRRRWTTTYTIPAPQTSGAGTARSL